jgi:DNA-binding NarL/FixJ family response regulator
MNSIAHRLSQHKPSPRAQGAAIKIVLLSEHAANALFQEDAFHAGANGCVLPSVSHADFLAALDAIMNGKQMSHQSGFEIETPSRLTQREIEILRRAADGKPDKEIAQELRLSVNTVRNHIQNILRKLEVNDREAAVWRAKHWGGL